MPNPRRKAETEELDAELLQPGSGTMRTVPATAADLADESAATLTLRAQASFRTIIEISPELVFLHRDGRIVYANPAVVRALGATSSDELVGTQLLELIHMDDRPSVASCLMQPADPKATCQTVGLRWRRRAGGYRTTEAVAARVDFEGADAVLVVARDVTERAEFQHQLVQRDRMAALGTLAAGVAHEINNPLTYLLVNVEHVLRRLRAASAADDPVAELVDGHAGGLGGLAQSLQHAVDGAHRVRQIVRDLLTFAQGNVEQRGRVDVRSLLESATQMAW